MESAIMAIIAAIFSAISTAAANRQNAQNNRELLEQQYGYSTEAANRANEEARSQYWDLYSPQSKVQQLKDANLSVGLMYGNGYAGGGSASAAQAATPSASAPVMNPLANLGTMSEVLKAVADSKKQEKDIEKTDAEIDEIRQNIAESGARIEEIKSKINSAEYQNRLTEMQTNLTKQQTDYAELQTKFDNETYEERAKQFKIMNDKTVKEIESMTEEINGMIIDNSYKAELNQAIIDNYKAQRLQYLQNVEVLKMEKAQKEIQNKILQAQSEVEKQRLQKELNQMDETLNLTREYIITEQEKQKTEGQKRTNMSTSNAAMQMRIENYQIELFLGRAEKIASAAGVIF